jgi:hypothetical protein
MGLGDRLPQAAFLLRGAYFLLRQGYFAHPWASKPEGYEGQAAREGASKAEGSEGQAVECVASSRLGGILCEATSHWHGRYPRSACLLPTADCLLGGSAVGGYRTMSHE